MQSQGLTKSTGQKNILAHSTGIVCTIAIYLFVVKTHSKRLHLLNQLHLSNEKVHSVKYKSDQRLFAFIIHVLSG